MDFLFKFAEERRVKELRQGDIRAVAELFDGGNGRIFAAGIDNVVDRRLRDATDDAKLVDGDIPLGAKLQYTLFDRVPQFHGKLLFAKLSLYNSIIENFCR